MPDQTKYTSKLHNARVLVIGGSSGLGFAAAEAALENGATVILSSSNPDRLSAAQARLTESYPSLASRISGHPCDLSNHDTLESNIAALLAAATSSGAEKLDHIVFTAADALAIAPLSTTTLPSILRAGTLRFFAPILVAKHAPAHMNPGPASSIVLTTGSVSERPRPDWTVVGAFATGLHGLTRGLALDLAPLRVNLISPGAVDTELWAGMDKGVKEEMFKKIEASAPTGRVGRAEDVAEAFLYTMRDWNLTGSVISTNSGALLKG